MAPIEPIERKVPGRTRADRAAGGQALRERVPRASHGSWKLPKKQRDPVAILQRSNAGRLKHLVPIRFGRMLQSPFTFLRGAAAVMAYDLSHTPASGLQVQACGDCHLLNFGLFATPERNLVFDLNDFDETLPAPWEWDLKRLVASFVVAARSVTFTDRQARGIVQECVGSYRRHMRAYAQMTPLEVWYDRIDWQHVIEKAPDARSRRFRQELADQARRRIVDHLFPKIAAADGGHHHLVDQPPVLYHVHEPAWRRLVRRSIREYRQSLSDDRRVLLDRYRVEDVAVKVVGIGSVGTRCYVGLLMSDEEQPLLLQFKEAGRSVLEPYTRRSAYENQGQRVVMGQRLMQSSSDIFLGWAKGRNARDFYVRQLRDMKLALPVETMKPIDLERYAQGCGRTLARAHAKSGDAAAISGYVGRGDNLDRALANFAISYADQTERDHTALVKAVRAGRVEVLAEEG